MANEQDVRDLLVRCTARLTDAETKTTGSGFFIDERHLITCGHVVAGKQIFVQAFGRQPRPGTLLDPAPTTDDDLALVEIASDSEYAQPAVLLQERTRNPLFFAAGYARDDFDPGGIEVRPYEGDYRRNPNDEMDTSLQLRDVNITFGMSGGPVLDRSTCGVVGILRYTKDARGTTGGGAIPLARAATRFDMVQHYVREPPMATREWRAFLPEGIWSQVGLARWYGHLHLRLDGSRSSWQVGVAQGNQLVERSFRNIGDEVADVLFKWAQRGRVRSEGEVRLLGKLLSAALFPEGIKERLQELSRGDEVLVRLETASPDLTDMPWEFATVPGEDTFLAAEHHYQFVRVTAESRDAGEPTTPARALAIVVQPDSDRLPVANDDMMPVLWPGRDQLGRDVRSAIERPGIQLQKRLLLHPATNEVEDAFREATTAFDVIHYQGYSHLTETGEPKLALSNGEGGLKLLSAKTFFDWVNRLGSRLLVMEFLIPPDDRQYEPVPPSALFESFPRKSVSAIIYNRVPMHVQQLKVFNKILYEMLAASETVEKSVQKARIGLQTAPVIDYAGFGWFTLSTGLAPGMRLVAKEPERKPTVQEHPGEREQQLVGAVDDFNRTRP